MSIISFLLTACSTSMKIPPVQNLDLTKYSGVWYEIARYDHFFERDLDNVTATYTINSDGTVKVLNRGIKSGVEKTITGKATRPDDKEQGILKVVFFLFGSEYRVIFLDDAYRYAVVTSSSSDYLWILARTPVIDNSKLDELKTFITEKGFKADKLIFVKHN